MDRTIVVVVIIMLGVAAAAWFLTQRMTSLTARGIHQLRIGGQHKSRVARPATETLQLSNLSLSEAIGRRELEWGVSPPSVGKWLKKQQGRQLPGHKPVDALEPERIEAELANAQWTFVFKDDKLAEIYVRFRGQSAAAWEFTRNLGKPMVNIKHPDLLGPPAEVNFWLRTGTLVRWEEHPGGDNVIHLRSFEDMWRDAQERYPGKQQFIQSLWKKLRNMQGCPAQ